MPRVLSGPSARWRRLTRTFLIAGIAVLLPRSADAQATPSPDQAELVRDLGGKDWLKRFDAASAILGVPAAQRDKTTIAAVVRELQRVQQLKYGGVEELPAAVKDRNAALTYHDNLLDIVSESDDPVVIPALIGAGLDDGLALEARARFGEAAMPQILAALGQHQSSEQQEGLLYTLRLMCETSVPLSAGARASIVEIDRRYLTSGRSAVVERAIDLAVALDETELLARVKAIAHARTEKDAGLTLKDPENLPRVAGSAREALAAIEGPEPMRSEAVLLEDLRSPHGRIVNDAAAEILLAPSSRRTPAMVAALVAAMPRLMQIGRDQDDRGGECGFKCELINLAVKADDPALIPVLVRGLEVGSPIQWLVKQGDAAAPALVDESLRNTNPAYLSAALLTFRFMLERNLPLSVTSKAGMATVAGRELSSRYPTLVSGAIEIAGLLGDPGLTSRLKEIADARTMREAKLNLLGGDTEAAFARLSAAASKALLRIR